MSKANRIYDSDVSVLNFLDLSYLKTGNKEEASKLFSASLRINKNQQHISEILRELK